MYHVETCMFYVCLYLDSIIQCIKRVFESINSAPSRWGRELRRTRVIRVRNVYHIRINTCETSVSRCDHSSRMIHVLRVYHECITDPLRDTCITVYQSCVSQHDTLSLCISAHQCASRTSSRWYMYQDMYYDSISTDDRDTLWYTLIQYVFRAVRVIKFRYNSNTMWYICITRRYFEYYHNTAVIHLIHANTCIK